jgi:hypothetical protein
MENVRKCQIDIFRVLCGGAGRTEGYLKLFSRRITVSRRHLGLTTETGEDACLCNLKQLVNAKTGIQLRRARL